MFCAGRVPEEDLKRTMKACGGSIQTTVANLTSDVLGTCAVFEETQIGGERYLFMSLTSKHIFYLHGCSNLHSNLDKDLISFHLILTCQHRINIIFLILISMFPSHFLTEVCTWNS